MDGTGLEERVHWWCSGPKGYAKKKLVGAEANIKGETAARRAFCSDMLNLAVQARVSNATASTA
jgi:hypothetical protein